MQMNPTMYNPQIGYTQPFSYNPMISAQQRMQSYDQQFPQFSQPQQAVQNVGITVTRFGGDCSRKGCVFKRDAFRNDLPHILDALKNYWNVAHW